MSNTRYYIGFSKVNGIGPARLARLIEHCGSVEAAWKAPPLTLARGGLDQKLIAALAAMRAGLDLDAELLKATRLGVALHSWEDAAYPERLAQAPGPPPLLYVRGKLAPADDCAVAVVGTRAPTPYGCEATRSIVTDLARAGVTVVSGLAIGIDTVAHQAALDAGGRTIAVLPCGIDDVYPQRNHELARRIARSGALLSEFPIGTRPSPPLFPSRNRLISGLALGVLVVEAGATSGALITVDFALEQGRDVFAVPGPIFSPSSAGTHRIIREGACLVRSADDILEALQMGQRSVQREARAEIAIDPIETALLALLSHEPQHVDLLARASGQPLPVVSSALAMLELKGRVRQVGAMQFVRER